MSDTENAALEARIDELCAEVERLRSCLSDDAENARMIMGENAKLQGENAKLRKMNDAMWLIIRCAIGEISARDGLPVIHEDDLRMLRNMRQELGIEVVDA